MAHSKDLEPQLPAENAEVAEMAARFGPPSALTCPDCGGALWQVEDGRLARYQCHVGHQYGPEALDTEQRAAIDNALWTAVRALEEHADLKGRLARRAADNGLHQASEGFAERAREAHSQAQTVRSLLFGAASSSPVAAESEAAANAEGVKVHRNFARARRRN